MEKLEKNFNRRERKSAYQERKGEITENEKKVLENLRGMVDWFNRYQEDNFGQDSDVTGSKAVVLKKYFSDFKRELSVFESVADEDEVLTQARTAQLVFLGDYHNLLKNQKFSADFIDKLAKCSKAPGVLVVEFVSPKEQEFLNQYLGGEIDERTFLKKINFENWDDPEHWPGYRQLIDVAKRHSMPIFGIKRGGNVQKKRDEFFASRLGEISGNNPDARIIVNIGDIHLASSHLPAEISKLSGLKHKKTLRVFQNLELLYFTALEKYENFAIPKVLKVEDGIYNIFTAPIITRLISNVENLNYFVGENEDAFPPELWVELVARMRKMAGYKELAEEDLDALPVYFGQEADAAWEELKEPFSSEELEKYERTLEQKGCVYIPPVGKEDVAAGNIIIIKRFRLKRVLEELAKFTFWPEQKGEDFLYFCSKFFIPERQPENDTERAGEKIFQDWLVSRKVSF